MIESLVPISRVETIPLNTFWRLEAQNAQNTFFSSLYLEAKNYTQTFHTRSLQMCFTLLALGLKKYEPILRGREIFFFHKDLDFWKTHIPACPQQQVLSAASYRCAVGVSDPPPHCSFPEAGEQKPFVSNLCGCCLKNCF